MAGERTLDDVINGFQAVTNQFNLPNPRNLFANTTPYIEPLRVPAPMLQPPMATAASVVPQIDLSSARQHQMGLMAAQQQQAISGGPMMNLPQAQMFTPSQFGVFRSGIFGPSQYPNQPGLFGSPLATLAIPPPMPTPTFSMASDVSMRYATDFSRRMQAADMSLMQGFAKTMVAGAGGWVGSGVGALLGSPFGMAGAGSAVGGIAGSMAGFSDTVNSGVSWMFEPSLRRASQAMRLREASESSVIGGPGLDISGRGMSPTSATQLTRRLGNLSDSQFNQTDIINMTQLSSEAGILGMAQNNDQIFNTMKGVIKTVGIIAKMTGDPDVISAIKNIAQMRNFGMTLPETAQMFSQLRQDSRMSGMSINNLLSQAGQMGGMVYQNVGMTAGTGVGIGAFNQALAQASVAGGTFSPQQLSLMGGVSGLQQQMTEVMAGTMKGNIGQTLLGAVLQSGKGGQLGIDKGALNQILQGGGIDFGELVRKAGTNLSDPKTLEQFHFQKRELLDTLQRQLGGVGTMQFLGNVGQGTQKTLNLSSMEGAFGGMGMDPQLARSVSGMLQNPMMYQIQQQHRQISLRENQLQEEAELSGISTPMGMAWNRIKGMSLRDQLAPNLDMTFARQAEQERAEAMGIRSRQDPGMLPGQSGIGALRGALKRNRRSVGGFGQMRSASTLMEGLDFAFDEFSAESREMREAQGDLFPWMPNVRSTWGQSTGDVLRARSDRRVAFQENIQSAISALSSGMEETNTQTILDTRRKIEQGLSTATMGTGEAMTPDRLRRIIDSASRAAVSNSKGNLGLNMQGFIQSVFDDTLKMLSAKDADALRKLYAADRKSMEHIISVGVHFTSGEDRQHLRRALGNARARQSNFNANIDFSNAKKIESSLKKYSASLANDLVFSSSESNFTHNVFDEDAGAGIMQALGKVSSAFGGDEQMFSAYLMSLGGGGTAAQAQSELGGKLKTFQELRFKNADLLNEESVRLKSLMEMMTGEDSEGNLPSYSTIQSRVKNALGATDADQMTHRLSTIQRQLNSRFRKIGQSIGGIGSADEVVSIIKNKGSEIGLGDLAGRVRGQSTDEAFSTIVSALGDTVEESMPGKEFGGKTVTKDPQLEMFSSMQMQFGKFDQATDALLQGSKNLDTAANALAVAIGDKNFSEAVQSVQSDEPWYRHRFW